MQRARAVIAAAKAEPKKYKKFVEEMDRTGRVNGVYKKLVRARQAEKIAKAPLPRAKGQAVSTKRGDLEGRRETSRRQPGSRKPSRRVQAAGRAEVGGNFS